MNRGDSAKRNFTTIVRAFTGALLGTAALAATPAAAQAAVYWGNYDHGRIGRMDNSGSPSSPSLISDPVGPFGVAAVDGRLYWADNDSGTIGRADISGATPAAVENSFITGQDGVFAVAADEDHVYWGTVYGEIGRAAINPDGSLGAVEDELVIRAGYVEGLAVTDGAIYWSDFDESNIGRATLAADGSVVAVEDDLLTIGGAAGIAIAGSHLYWVNVNGNSLGRARIDADGTLSALDQTFITGALDPTGVAVSGSEVFWTNANSSQAAKGSLSRARLAPDGSVQSVQHELLFDDSGVFGIAIDNPRDREAPFITMTPLAPASGAWFSAAGNPNGVRVDVAASDPSGVAALSCTDGVNTVLADTGGAAGSFTLLDGVHNISCTATDGASPPNTGAAPGSAAFPVTLRVDITPPSISCGTAPVDWVAFNVGFLCASSDDGSGLADAADAQFFLVTNVPAGSADAAAPSDTRAVSDVAGNTNTAGPLTAKVDLAPPTITCPAPPELELGGPAPPLVATVTDAGAGPASPTASGTTSTAVAGNQTTTVTAFDRLGTSASVECSYSVVAKPNEGKYVFKGLRNLTNDRSFRYGRHIPLRFRLTDASGRPVKNAVARLSVVRMDGEGTARASQRGKRSTDLFRHVGKGRYLYLLDTRRLSGPGEYEVRVSLDDGSVQTAPLNLRSKRHHPRDNDGDERDD